ncbi:MAG: preprotein translocase subunit YajC [Candidatus Sumerlaeaceae bacterium]|nr:preprotein translocase subunit YajC [Candidatus Sumerlaeaceae bacterium]
MKWIDSQIVVFELGGPFETPRKGIFNLMDWLGSLVLAAQGGGSTQGGAPQQQILQLVLMFGSIFAVFYLLILRPQKREQNRQQQIRDSIKKGDKVVTIGGAHGTVVAVDTTNNTVAVQVDKNCKIDFDRAAIQTVITKDTGETGGDKASS